MHTTIDRAVYMDMLDMLYLRAVEELVRVDVEHSV